MDYKYRCLNCFTEISENSKFCPHCGFKNGTPQISSNCLKMGLVLKNRYIVGKALGVGGFGITYKCFDTKMGGICAIKEYFPSIYVTRAADGHNVEVYQSKIDRYNIVMNGFLKESRLLGTLRHRNIISVYESFLENRTAYYVMEYCDGIDLRRYTNNFKNHLNYSDGMNIMYQVMNGLEYIHNKGVLHRDIAPDNIYITKNNIVKILDFGSARYEMDQMNRELSVIIKAGYAPIEQYGGKGHQGAYTDIYALGATFYHLFSGVMPIESTNRISEDKLVPFSQLRNDLPNDLKLCIEKSMSIVAKDRIQNIPEMKKILNVPISDEPIKQPPVSHQLPPTPSTPSQPIHVRASLPERINAYMCDFIIYGLINFIIAYFGIKDKTASTIVFYMFPITMMCINIITELTAKTTLGKKILGLEVRDISSNDGEASQIILRNIVKLMGIFVLLIKKDDDLLDDLITNSRVYKIGGK